MSVSPLTCPLRRPTFFEPAPFDGAQDRLRDAATRTAAPQGERWWYPFQGASPLARRPHLFGALSKGLLAIGALLILVTRAGAADFKLWPLIDHRSDAAGQRTVHLLGPLFSYQTGGGADELSLRPLFTFTRGPRAARSQLSILYPLFVSRWQPERTEYRLFGLISYVTETERHPDAWAQRFTIFPFVFYRSSAARGASLSVLPFYADLQNFFGYERIHMIAFPFYLRLQEPLVERTWLPFPFVSWSGGTLGRGYRIWPLYGWQHNGEKDRFVYVLWPFYISHERHFTRPERESQLIMFPFYSRAVSATKDSRSYGLFTHTTDRTAGTQTWGFPWPLWLAQRNLDTGERTALRLAPFYEDTHFGDRHAHFVLWPLYRWSTQQVDSYRHTRRDAFLLLYRDIEDVQSQYDHRRHLRTVFPLFRTNEEDGHNAASTLALLDALFPHDPTIERLYAPLWQLYSRGQEPDQPPRWSLLWDVVSSDGTRVRYPVYIDLTP